MRPDPQAYANVLVLAIKSALAPYEARLAVLEAKPVSTPDIAPEDIAASVAGLLSKELADLDIHAPVRIRKRIVRDAQGRIERVIEEPI